MYGLSLNSCKDMELIVVIIRGEDDDDVQCRNELEIHRNRFA